MEEDEERRDFKERIIAKLKELINDDEDLVGKGKSLIDKIFKANYIGKNSIDNISFLLDYIKKNIFS